MVENISSNELKKAHKERKGWEKKATYWHNAIPNFNYNIRASLTNDVQAVLNFEQLELNKDLHSGIKWNNRINLTLSSINLILLVINIILIFVL